MIMANLANSEGWNVKLPIFSHRIEPPAEYPRPKTLIATRRNMASNKNGYVKDLKYL
jgi:hypothetical protein